MNRLIRDKASRLALTIAALVLIPWGGFTASHSLVPGIRRAAG